MLTLFEQPLVVLMQNVFSFVPWEMLARNPLYKAMSIGIPISVPKYLICYLVVIVRVYCFGSRGLTSSLDFIHNNSAFFEQLFIQYRQMKKVKRRQIACNLNRSSHSGARRKKFGFDSEIAGSRLFSFGGRKNCTEFRNWRILFYRSDERNFDLGHDPLT